VKGATVEHRTKLRADEVLRTEDLWMSEELVSPERFPATVQSISAQWDFKVQGKDKQRSSPIQYKALSIFEQTHYFT